MSWGCLACLQSTSCLTAVVSSERGCLACCSGLDLVGSPARAIVLNVSSLQIFR
jgi:hypothetical protein